MDFFVTVEWLSFYCLQSHSDYYGIYYYYIWFCFYEHKLQTAFIQLGWGWLRLEGFCYLILYFRMKFVDLWLRAKNAQNTHALLQFN